MTRRTSSAVTPVAHACSVIQSRVIQRRAAQGCVLLVLASAFLVGNSVSHAQSLHRFHSTGMVPGDVGQQQAYRIPDGAGYFQPVQTYSSSGAQISLQNNDQFSPAQTRINAALMVGGVYTYRLTNLNEQPGAELYPTVEVIHRLYPPAHLAARFPVQIDINQADIDAALAGNFVVKVVYLEDPEASRTQAHVGTTQPSFDLAPGSDLLSTADLMGRPMAIVRIGSRVPEPNAAVLSPFTPPAHLLPPTDQQPATASVNWNQAMADRDPSYIPQMLPPSAGHAGMWNAEHIFDGGDRSIETLVGSGDNWEISGLETEDTIGHFDTLNGQRLVVASNRVAIYSPRFGAVRQTLNVAQTVRQVPALNAEGVLPQTVVGSHVDPTSTAQFEQMRLMRDATAAQGVRQRTAPIWTSGQVSTRETSGTNALVALVSVIEQAELSGSQKAMLAKGRQAALTWGGVEGVQVVADFQSAMVVFDVEKADEIVESHSPFQRPKLQVVKLASQDAAQQGDVIDFVLRFKNVGDQTIGNVTLLDNLPDRLEFVAGSASCDLACQFYTQDNEQGSVILRWDIEKPLPVNAGGVIRFSCRVR